MLVDLHVHTTASDGLDSPEEVVIKAKRRGLGALAITDHDTLAGVKPALSAGRANGIEILPGIELSAEVDEDEVHILGYLLDDTNAQILETISFFRDCRLERIKKMVDKLRELGFAVTLQRVQAISGSGSIGRPHLAAALVELGAVLDVAEAFDKLIGRGAPAYVPRYHLPPLEAIRLIRAAHGVPVLAHPGLDKAGERIPELIRAGLGGIEAYHPAHTRELCAYYHRLAEGQHLLVTGGSDYHGSGHKEGRELGMATVSAAELQKMKDWRAAQFF